MKYIRKTRSNKKQLVIYILSALSVGALLLAGCEGQSLTPDPSLIQIQEPVPVILDVDMGHQDMFAALFLLAHPNVDVTAITVSGTGEAHCEPGVTNAMGLTVLTGQQEVPVSCGRELPLAGTHAFPAAWRQAADDAYGVDIPSGGNESSLKAPDLIAEIAAQSEEKISIVAVGPLTNIAEFIQDYPDRTGQIGRIYIMGGAVHVGGNVGPEGAIPNEVSEWNIYIDPLAAGIVFTSGIPITLVPLDATQDVPVTRKFLEALGEHKTTRSAQLVYDMISANLDFVDSGGLQFWDSLTAAIFTDESLAKYEELHLVMIEEEGPESGRTKVDPEGDLIQVAVTANKKVFERTFLTVINWQGN